MSIETTEAPEAVDSAEPARQSVPKYVGARISMKQMKMWLSNARPGPANCPEKAVQHVKLGERATILSLMEVRKPARHKRAARD